MLRFKTIASSLCLAALLAVAVDACTPMSAAQLRARSNFRSECTGCHPLPAPGHLDRAGWEQILPLHRERVELSDAEWADLLDMLSPAQE